MTKEESKQVYLYCSAKLLERTAYYGLRAVLVLYLVSETIGMSTSEAIAIYGWFTAGLFIFQIIGALLGDLLLGNKNAAVIGGILHAMGALFLCFESTWSLYLGMGFIGLGGGFFTPNLFSEFGKSIVHKEKLLDGRHTLFYMSINAGSFIGVLLLGYLGELLSYKIAFIMSGLLAIAAIAILYFIPSKSNDLHPMKTKGLFQNKLKNLLAISLISGIFWALYELGSGDLHFVSFQIGEQYDFLPKSILSSMGSLTSILFGVIAMFLWFVYYINRFIKLFLGFLSCAISFGMLFFVPPDSVLGVVVFFVALLFYGASEILISPTIQALINKMANPKYLATVFTVIFIPGRLFFFLAGKFAEYSADDEPGGLFIVSGTLLVIFGVLIYSLRNHFKDEPLISKEIEEIGTKAP
ncbi:MAG: peptide MFS transporter [Aureisphaera sp.]